MTARDAVPDFAGLRVLALESRRSVEVASVIATYGGTPIVAPALREVRGARIAVQEYGVSSVDLLEGLQARGADVSRVPVYRWPHDSPSRA